MVSKYLDVGPVGRSPGNLVAGCCDGLELRQQQQIDADVGGGDVQYQRALSAVLASHLLSIGVSDYSDSLADW
jgi:hypothetical protein